MPGQPIRRLAAVPPQTWKEIAAWGRKTGLLTKWESSFARDMASYAARGKLMTERQVTHALAIYNQAMRAGLGDGIELPKGQP